MQYTLLIKHYLKKGTYLRLSLIKQSYNLIQLLKPPPSSSRDQGLNSSQSQLPIRLKSEARISVFEMSRCQSENKT